jgi:hypothetical protein
MPCGSLGAQGFEVEQLPLWHIRGDAQTPVGLLALHKSLIGWQVPSTQLWLESAHTPVGFCAVQSKVLSMHWPERQVFPLSQVPVGFCALQVFMPLMPTHCPF